MTKIPAMEASQYVKILDCCAPIALAWFAYTGPTGRDAATV
ncbi:MULTISPECIES: hypothetical protein [unclassified Synechocystis]|nr:MULTISPECIES: hypothetical protein [unclassified Synechocystis]